MLILLIALYTQLLVDAGKAVDAQSIMTGQLHPEFQRLTQEHANTQARVRRQSHVGFERRVAELEAKFPGFQFAEICSESWRGETAAQAAKDAFEVSWPASKGHWRVANSPCTYYGIAMARGGKIWYVTMLVGYELP